MNPFALVTAAHLLTRSTRGSAEHRFAAKRRLARVETASAADVGRWARRVLDARTLDEVFSEVS